MQSEARVTRLDGDDAIVELAGPSAGGCGRCHEPGGCGGSSVIGQVFGPRTRSFRIPNVIGVLPGEAVLVELGEGMLWRVAVMAYLLPVMLLVLGAFVAMTLFPAAADLAAAAGGALGFGLAMLAAARFQARRRRSLEPAMLRRPQSCSR
jgi:sigma-E factor negative regulatory protein RseC